MNAALRSTTSRYDEEFARAPIVDQDQVTGTNQSRGGAGDQRLFRITVQAPNGRQLAPTSYARALNRAGVERSDMIDALKMSLRRQHDGKVDVLIDEVERPDSGLSGISLSTP